MSDPMPPELRESLIALAMAEGPARLLDRLQAFQGIDLAGLPFRLLDRLLATGAEGDPAALARLAPLLPGGQPRLFAAICDGLAHSDTAALERLRADPAAHRMTRWEATGWAVFLRHRGPLPGQPVARIMQFWDRAEPPADVDRAMAGWDHLGPVVRRFDAAHAGRFIARVAGADAARDFAALWHPALQSDLFRLYWLLETGGAYIDADGLAQPGAAALLAQAAGGGMVAAAMTRLPRAVAINGVLVAPKGDPLIADWLAEALRRIHDRPGGPIFWLTGPGCLTELLWARGSTSTGPVLLPLAALDQAFRQLDAGYKQTEANWRVAEHRAGLSDAADIRRLFPQKT